MSQTKATRYPSPGAIGGKLIREIVGNLKRAQITLPLSSHILIATSAGADSTALATLMAKYGRRVGRASQIILLHVNHGWRGKESDADQRHVEKLARKLGVQVIVHKLDGPPKAKGQSWEDEARKHRRRIFDEESRKHGNAPVLTAHHADDLAETLLWRLFTGAAETHGAGILLNDPPQVRPLLTTRREILQDFLREESQLWREDSSNRDPRFLRAKMRGELMPIVEKLFPRAIERLTALGIRAQTPKAGGRTASSALVDATSNEPPLDLLFKLGGLRAKRAHYESIASLKPGGSCSLPQGWSVRRSSQGWELVPSLDLDRVQDLKIPRKSRKPKGS